MADNVAITAGAGTTVATDEVDTGGGAAHVQLVKILDGTDGGTNRVAGTTARGLRVDPKPQRVVASDDSAGLTTATTLYAAGDQLGTILELTSVAAASAGGGSIASLRLVCDVSGVIGPVRAWFFSGSVTLAADNAAFSISDTDMAKFQGAVVIPAPASATNNAAATATNINLDYVCDATSLFVALETLSTHTVHFAAVDDLHLSAAAYLL